MSFLSEQGKKNDLYRILAIDQHHKSEMATAHILAFLLQIPIDVASIIFFTITSNPTRYKIISETLKLRKSPFQEFWARLTNFRNQADRARNKIIHWNIISYTDGSQEMVNPKTRYMDDEEHSVIKSEQLNDMIKLICDVRAITEEFSSFLAGNIRGTLPEIYLRPPKG